MNILVLWGNVNEFMNLTIFGNTLWRIWIAVIIFLFLFFLVKSGLKHLWKLTNKISLTKEKRLFALFESIQKLPNWFWLLIELFVISKILILPENIDHIANIVLLFVGLFGIAKIVIKITTFFVSKILEWNKAWQKTVELIINILVWVIWILIFLTNIWVNLTPLVASLWIASIAVAFALQNILTDLFASFSILFSKPFIIWDYIEVWSNEWTVLSITLKSTSLQNTAGQEVVIPNSTILTSNVVNYGKASFRRQRPVISVTYSTSIDHLKEIPWIIEWVIKNVNNIEFERCHLQKMNDYSLDFLCSYKSLSPDYTKMLEANEQIYLWILTEFEKKWIELAFPSQTIYNYNQS